MGPINMDNGRKLLTTYWRQSTNWFVNMLLMISVWISWSWSGMNYVRGRDAAKWSLQYIMFWKSSKYLALQAQLHQPLTPLHSGYCWPLSPCFLEKPKWSWRQLEAKSRKDRRILVTVVTKRGLDDDIFNQKWRFLAFFRFWPCGGSPSARKLLFCKG